MKRVLYPGSFDPITKGHMNVIEQAIEMFDEVIVAVSSNPNKSNYFFTLEERVNIIKEIYYKRPEIKVIGGDIASVDLALLHECKAIVRGLRSITDFDYEIQMAQINRDISNDKVNTVCLFADSRLQTISSSAVREIFGLSKDISRYVDPVVEKHMVLKKVSLK